MAKNKKEEKTPKTRKGHIVSLLSSISPTSVDEKELSLLWYSTHTKRGKVDG